MPALPGHLSKTGDVPDNSAKIAELQAILQAGASSVAVDGTNVAFDLAEVRQQLRELMASDQTNAGRRPVASSINLGGF